MSKLLKLKEWLTLDDAARHLSSLLSETASQADLLHLAIEKRLVLSVLFVNHVRARKGRAVPLSDAETVPGIPIPGQPQYQVVLGERISEDEVLQLDAEVVTLSGVWDLPMIGAEALDVLHEYMSQVDGPSVTLQNLAGALVRSPKDPTLICQLQEHFSDNDFFKGDLAAPYDNRANFYPAGGLPSDCVLVVRPANLSKLVDEMNGAEAPEKPLGTRERATLLVMVAALAKEAKIDLTAPWKAAELIEKLTTELGSRVPVSTVDSHLKKIPDALERKSS